MIDSKKPNRIDILASNQSNTLLDVILQLSVPLICVRDYRLRTEAFKSVYLSNGGIFVAPVERDLLIQHNNLSRYVTNKEIGIAASLVSLREMIDRMKTDQEKVMFVKAFNALHAYVNQLQRMKSSIEESAKL